VEIALAASDPDGDALTLRVVNQPEHGTTGLAAATARYVPEPGFTGEDIFTFTASDGSTDGNLATVVVTVQGASCTGDCDGDGTVGINELVSGVSIALAMTELASCEAFDLNGDAAVTVDELIQGINAALTGCAGPG
jgi:hypothetical protein